MSPRPSVVLALVLLVAHPPPQAGSCSGCIGAAGSGTSSSGTCPGTVSITVEVERGMCRWTQESEELLLECTQTRGCKTTITRSWSDLPSGSDVDFCVLVGGDKLCLKPRTTAESSSNNKPRTGPTLDCSDEDELTFTVESPDCNLSAQVQATCSACREGS